MSSEPRHGLCAARRRVAESSAIAASWLGSQDCWRTFSASLVPLLAQIGGPPTTGGRNGHMTGSKHRARPVVHKVASVIVAIAVIGGAVALGYWAGRVAYEPPADPFEDELPPLSYVVEEGTVGRSISFTAVAEWTPSPAGENGATGVVTSTDVDPGTTVEAGEAIYTVNLRPVVVAQGDVPMFRALSLRSEGADVAQLQMLLADLGYLDAEADGVFGATTRNAVKAWQESLSVTVTGVVERGDIVFLSSLPLRATLGENVVTGMTLVGGETAILSLPDTPLFQIPLTIDQGALVPLFADVAVEYPDGLWKARVTQAIEQPATGQLNLILGGPGETSICLSDCARWVGLQERTEFRAHVVVVPETIGPIVPAAAISVDAANRPAVMLADGSLLEIEPIQSANGLVVVKGLEPGTTILLLEDGQ